MVSKQLVAASNVDNVNIDLYVNAINIKKVAPMSTLQPTSNLLFGAPFHCIRLIDAQERRNHLDRLDTHTGHRNSRFAWNAAAATLATVLVLALALALPLALLIPNLAFAADEPAATKKFVRVIAVATARDLPPLPFSGTVRAGNRAPLAFQTNGRLAQRPAEVGQNVKAGDLLAVLSNPQLKPALEAAKARVLELQTRTGQSQRDLERVRRLRQSGAATTEELEQVRANQQALQASLSLAIADRDRAQQLLDETRLTAPFSGQIAAVYLETGQIVAPGQTVVELSGAGGLELEIGVPANLLPRIRAGSKVPLSQFSQPLGVSGTISRLSQSSIPGQLNRVIISLPRDDRLHAGSTLTIGLPAVRSDHSLEVPIRAVIDTGRGIPRVFRYAEGRVESVAVELQKVLGRTVMIKGPLKPGEQVVYAGLAGLQDGAIVHVLNAPDTVQADR